MEATSFQDEIISILNDNFKDLHVLVFDLSFMQNAIELCHYPKLFRGPLRLELNFTFPLEHVTDLFVVGKQVPLVENDKLIVVGKNIL